MAAVGSKAFRKKNFAHLVEVVWRGNRPAVAEAMDWSAPNLVTRYMNTGKSSKPIGEDVARKIEIAARAAGADWVNDGWMDEVHDFSVDGPPKAPIGKHAGTFEERLTALPDALRRYVLMELDICERVQQLAPNEFMRPPTVATRRAFQQYLHDMLEQLQGKPRNAA